jgi:HlyD family secretion protein
MGIFAQAVARIRTAVGSQVAGVVTKVHVRIGQEVKAGTLLFELDRRTAEADLKVREAALASAQEQYRKLQLQPRPEEVPVSEAQVGVALANIRSQQDLRDRDERLPKDTVADQDRIAHEQGYRGAKAQLAYAKASLALLKAGAWEPDKAEAILEEARAQGSGLITLATHGRSGVRRMLLGSVADRLIRSATSPVLVCRPSAERH